MDVQTQIDATGEDGALPVKDWPGVWPGVVVNTADETGRGLVQVRVPQVHGEPTEEDEFVPDEDLPWARPCHQVHDYHYAWAEGDGVWVAFWGGSSSNPVILGQFIGDGDLPDAAESAYVPDPRTRLIRTNNGHEFEMRWVPGQERVTMRSEAGNSIEMIDTPGGPIIRISTPDQTIEMIDTGSAINVTTTGTVTTQANNITDNGVLSNMTFTGAGIWQFLSLAITCAAALTLTATGLLSITGAGLVLATTGGQIALGAVGGSKQALVLENFITDIFNLHTHGGVTSGPGSTGPPSPLGVTGTHSTQNVIAD